MKVFLSTPAPAEKKIQGYIPLFDPPEGGFGAFGAEWRAFRADAMRTSFLPFGLDWVDGLRGRPTEQRAQQTHRASTEGEEKGTYGG